MKVRRKKSGERQRSRMKISPGERGKNNPWLLAGLPPEEKSVQGLEMFGPFLDRRCPTKQVDTYNDAPL